MQKEIQKLPDDIIKLIWSFIPSKDKYHNNLNNEINNAIKCEIILKSYELLNIRRYINGYKIDCMRLFLKEVKPNNVLNTIRITNFDDIVVGDVIESLFYDRVKMYSVLKISTCYIHLREICFTHIGRSFYCINFNDVSYYHDHSRKHLKDKLIDNFDLYKLNANLTQNYYINDFK